MLKEFSDKSMLTKVRARFGRRLTARHYDELCAMSTVGDVAAYLKNQPCYDEALAGVDPTAIHRGQLESILRQRVFSQYAGLVKFDFNGGIGFYRYVLIQQETEQLITLLRLLQANSPESYILLLPGYLIRYASFDLEALGRVRSFDGLLEALRHTGYADILKKFRPARSGEPIDLLGCETALHTYCNKTILGLIDQYFSGENRDQLREMMLTHVDVQNIARVWRLKQFFHADEQTIRAALVPIDTPSRRVIDRMIAAQNSQELVRALARSRYRSSGVVTSPDEPGYIEAVTDRGEYDLAMRNIRFSRSPAVVLVSYMVHLTQELENITNIIEGIRYGLPNEEIRRMLIL